VNQFLTFFLPLCLLPTLPGKLLKNFTSWKNEKPNQKHTGRNVENCFEANKKKSSFNFFFFKDFRCEESQKKLFFLLEGKKLLACFVMLFL
jgi:hypothetical protein